MVTHHLLTPDEQAVAVLLANAWNGFLSLPVEHGDDRDEFRHGIHALQDLVLARPGRRQLNERIG